MAYPQLATQPFILDEDRHYTIAEWLTVEELTGLKFEYHKGRLRSVRAMAGGSSNHALIAGNVMYSLGNLVRQTKVHEGQNGHSTTINCGVYSSDLRLKIEDNERYVYPDAAVVCGKPIYDNVVQTAVQNPRIVVEVLSPSSESYDTGDKFDYYASLPSLREYILVSQHTPRSEVRSRPDANTPWTIATVNTRDATILIPSIKENLPMQEVYRLVDFE